MPSVKIRRTWPCGQQESIEIAGFFIQAGEDDKARPCPTHGTACHKDIGKLPVM